MRLAHIDLSRKFRVPHQVSSIQKKKRKKKAKQTKKTVRINSLAEIYTKMVFFLKLMAKEILVHVSRNTAG